MLEFKPEFIIDQESKKKAVVIPYSQWEDILEALEELDDIKAYDEAKAQDAEVIPFDRAVKEIKGEAGA